MVGNSWPARMQTGQEKNVNAVKVKTEAAGISPYILKDDLEQLNIKGLLYSSEIGGLHSDPAYFTIEYKSPFFIIWKIMPWRVRKKLLRNLTNYPFHESIFSALQDFLCKYATIVSCLFI